MNRICKCEVQKLFPILEAIKEGKTIQFKESDGWRDINGDDEGFYLNTLVEKLINTASSQSQSIVHLRTQRSAGMKCRSTSRLGG